MNKTSFFIFGGYSTAVEIAETVALTNPEFELWHVVADDDAQVGANRIKDKDLAEFAANRVGEKFFILSQSNLIADTLSGGDDNKRSLSPADKRELL